MSLADRVAARGEADPRFLGVRFDRDARPVRCSGNTIVSHVTDPDLNAAITAIAGELAETPAGQCYAWLPPSSYHMTVFDGLLHDRRGPDYWPGDLAQDATNDAADAFMGARVGAIQPPDGGPFRARITGLAGFDGDGLGLSLVPVDDAENERIRGWRDLLAEASGLAHRPGHGTYAFHITLAYLIGWPDQTAARAFDSLSATAVARLADAYPVLTLGPAQFCHFDDMTEFRPQS